MAQTSTSYVRTEEGMLFLKVKINVPARFRSKSVMPWPNAELAIFVGSDWAANTSHVNNNATITRPILKVYACLTQGSDLGALLLISE